MSRNDPSVLHQLRKQEHPKPAQSRPEYQCCDVVHETDGPVDTLVDLGEGDGVVWQVPQIPLTVVDVGEVYLKGPDGGEYVLKRAQRTDGAYVIYPGIGVVGDLRRVASADDPREKR